jgi:hypothetical protein
VPNPAERLVLADKRFIKPLLFAGRGYFHNWEVF